jgi:hypothetical protein
MFPDHDWIETDFESEEISAQENEERAPPREVVEARKFERAYEKFLRLEVSQQLDAVTSLQVFLEKYPQWKVWP